jgi:hypothetical protein
MAMVLFFMGEFAEARHYLERAVELPPTRQEIVHFFDDNHSLRLGMSGERALSGPSHQNDGQA